MSLLDHTCRHRRPGALCLGVVALLLLAPSAAADDAVADAVYVGDQICLECHADQALTADQIHARIESFEVRGHAVGCEGCHGPGSRHAEELDPALIVRFGAYAASGDAACISCHKWKGMASWQASTHAMEEVSCTDCHSVHSEEPKNAVAWAGRAWASRPAHVVRPALARASDSCAGCHADVLASFELPSHHPLPEGKMSCADCHDVHSPREGMLRTEMRLNDLCYDCHQEKEGPFVFEHAPVEESCTTCHTVHGSVADNLLTANEPTLCLQCHEFHFHAGYEASERHEVDVGGIERDNAFGPEGFNIAFTTSCTDCHSQVHGSDLPSQTVPGSGRGLTR